MKKLRNKIVTSISIVILLFVGTNNAFAQDINSNKKMELGFRLMPTFTSLDVKTSSGGAVSGSVVLGFGAGVFLGYNFTNNIGVQGEIIYSSISQKSVDVNVERNINLRYINIPILLSLNTNKSKLINLNAVAGPQIGFNVGSSLSTSGTNNGNDPKPILSVSKNDIGFAYGLGMDLGFNENRTIRLSLGYRGVLGLLDVSDQSKTISNDSYYVLDRSHIKTNAFYLGLSILF